MKEEKRSDMKEEGTASLISLRPICWSSCPQLHSGLIPVFHYPILAVTIVTQQINS